MIEQYLEPAQPVVSDEEKGRQVILDNQAVIQTFLSQPHIQQLFQNFKDEDGNPIPPSLRQIHLHLHTPKGSLLDGFARIDDLMPLSREYGMPAVGVSEHGTMASHFDFYHAANEAGIKPIMGMEAYVTTNHKWKKPDFERVFYEMHNYGTPEEPLIHPKLYHISSEEMQRGGYTNVIEIKDSTIQKLMARIVESRFIQEIKQEYIQREEKPPSQAIIKKEVTRRKTASTRQGLRFCVKEKTQVRDLFSWRPHNNNHLLLIARTQEGYSNMLKLCSTGFLEGFYYKPRLDHHLLKKHAKGLIATSACLGSDINQCLLLGRDRVAKNLIKFYHKIFDEFYLEIQPSEQPEQHYVNKRLKEFSKEMGIPLICTTDVHMLKKEEKALHATITTIGQSEDTDGISVYDSCYFMSTEEILGKGIPIEAVMNTMEVAAKCNVALADDSIKFPVYDVPKGETFDSYLKKLSTNALFYYALHHDIDIDAYMKRLNYELEVVAKKNISAYFIIVWDYIKFARGRGILVGPGRG